MCYVLQKCKKCTLAYTVAQCMCKSKTLHNFKHTITFVATTPSSHWKTSKNIIFKALEAGDKLWPWKCTMSLSFLHFRGYADLCIWTRYVPLLDKFCWMLHSRVMLCWYDPAYYVFLHNTFSTANGHPIGAMCFCMATFIWSVKFSDGVFYFISSHHDRINIHVYTIYHTIPQNSIQY